MNKDWHSEVDGDHGGEPLVTVRDLVRTFGNDRVIDGVSFDIKAGEFVAISGPSGSGKTTLLHLLAALDRPDTGTIRVAGHDLVHLHRLTEYRRNQIGLVFQLHNLIPRLTSRQNVAIAMFGTGLGHRERARRAEELLATVGLAHRAGSKPPTMSGGERQRVAVARALANEPALLLADEPTASHDPRLNERSDRLLRLADGHIASVETP